MHLKLPVSGANAASLDAVTAACRQMSRRGKAWAVAREDGLKSLAWDAHLLLVDL